MKWRIKPKLDIEKIQSLKCLLFGAGTLGSQLARNLIAWGVRHITFIDYGKVNHSNPVRQSLYVYEDCINDGKPKAETAANALKQIFPSIHSEGYNLKIPMPGHTSTEAMFEQTLKDVEQIEKLVESHDACFLLFDSREARWLPTILGQLYNKITISVGLGFDSYVIMRHGVSPFVHDKKKDPERSGCFFCNDYLSPSDTMKDRTLDQQCTVTR